MRGQTVTVRAFGATHTGRVRAGNEDSFLVADAVFAVADGMGGHQAGEIASDAALEPLRDFDVSSHSEAGQVNEALAAAVREANTLVVDRASEDPELEGMGTTLTAVAIRQDQLHVAHVGDSRAYLLRDSEEMSQLTTDHTLVERLVQEGRLSRDEAATHPQRNVITRAIGHETTVDVEVLPPITLRDGDQILLCSDGLSGPVDDQRIAAVLTSTNDGEDAVAELLAQANAAGGPDNITAVLVRIGDQWDGAGDGDDTSARQLAETTPVAVETTDGDGATSSEASTRGVTTEPDEPEAEVPPPEAEHTGRSTALRIVGVVLLLGIVAAVVIGGGWLLLSRSYFVGEYRGMVAIYQGIPQDVGGVSAARVVPEEITTTPVSAFPAFRQQAIEGGLSAQSLDDARRIVADLQQQLRDSEEPDPSIGQPLSEPTQGP